MSTPDDPQGGQPSPLPPPAPIRKKRHWVRNSLIGLGAFIVLIVVIGVAAGGGNKASSASSSSASAAPAAAPSPTDTLSSQQHQFISDMRSQYNFNSAVSDSSIADFGRNICMNAQTGGASQSSLESLAQSSWTNIKSADAYGMVRVAEQDLCPSYLPAQTWHTIATFTGSSNTNTAQFTIQPYDSSNWVMKYTYTCSGQMTGTGNFIVNEDGGNDSSGTSSSVQLNNLDSGQNSQTNVYGDAGTHYLQIQTQCPYTITVMQKY